MSDKLAGGIKAGSTSVSLPVELRLAADSTEKTGVVYTDVTGSYWRQGGARTSITMATLGSVNAAYSSGGFVEVDGTNQPGVYRFDVPDAAFATGADWVVVTVKVASCFVQSFMFQLETVGAAELSARIPATLVSGRIDSSVGAMAANVVTAAAIATDAIDADALAADVVAEIQSGLAVPGDVMNLDPAYDAAKTAAQAGDAMTLDPAYDAAMTAAQPGDIPTAVENADALLGRNINGGSSSGRKVKDALKASRNKVDVSNGSSVKVYEEDDTTLAWELSITTDPNALPIKTIG